MTWITCTQVSSKNKFTQCMQERDVTYHPSCFKLHPEVSVCKCQNKVYHSIICLTIKQKWELLMHIICVLSGHRVQTIVVALDLDLIYCSMS